MSTLEGGGRIVTDGLVLYLDAANPKSYTSGSTVWYDLSRGGNNGLLVNGPTFNSNNKGSIVFDGVNDNVNLGNVLNIGLNSWTVSCWFKINSYVSGSTIGIIGKTRYDGSPSRYTSYIENNLIKVMTQIESTRYEISTSITPYLDNKFHNVVMTINRNGFFRLFIDSNSIGIQHNISSSSTVNMISTDNFYIGSYANSTGSSPLYFFNGNIANVQIYNRALTQDEIRQNYNATKSRYI